MSLDPIHLAIGFRLVNLVLLAYLIYFYSRSFRKIRSSFTTGLLFFSAILFLQNLSAVFFRLLSGADISDEVSVQNTVLNLMQAMGLSSLVYITRK